MDIKVIGFGALNMDHIYQVERILDDGEAVVENSTQFPGGSAANTIYGLARLGVSTGFVGAVGADADGRLLLQDFQNVGVDTGQIKMKSGASTGSALCLSDKLGRRSIYVLPGANSLLSADDLDFDYLNSAGMVHISSFADERQFQVLLGLIAGLAPSVRVSFSPGAIYAARGLEKLSPILARTHVLFLNEAEVVQLTGEGTAQGAEVCLKHGCQILAVTLGKGGDDTNTATSYIRSPENEYMIKPHDRHDTLAVADTTGAGDAFAAGFLYGLLDDRDLLGCGRLGNIVAQFSITKIGARQGLPSVDELRERYRHQYNEPL